MIAAKEAVNIAKKQADSLLGGGAFRLEEILREKYQDRDSWIITLSLPRRSPPSNDPLRLVTGSSVIAQMYPSDLEFKRFYVDAESGELLGMTIREFALR